MKTPPPFPKKKSRTWLWVVLLVGALLIAVIIAGGIVAYRSLTASGVTSGLDNKFGDQHLKTSVALIELHKVRFGRYPDSLRDLKFTGDWDPMWLTGVRYYPSPNRDAYYIEVERGWIGKPTFTMPPAFWKGTGYSPSLKPANQ
jgi:hypothetical protein